MYLIFYSLSLLLDAAMAAAAGSMGQLLLVTKSGRGWTWTRAARDDVTIRWHRELFNASYCHGFAGINLKN